MLAQSNKSRQLLNDGHTVYGWIHEESPIIFVSTLSLYMKQTILNAFYLCHHVVMY